MKALAGVMSLVVLLGAACAAELNTPEQLYQKALYLETAKADYQGAIPIYAAIISNHEQNVAFTIKALHRQGVCYEKIGAPDKAGQCAYKLVSQYVDAVNADPEIVDFTHRNIKSPVVRRETNISDKKIMKQTTGRKQIMDKLNAIILPSVEFQNANLEEVLAYLNEQSIIYDTSVGPKGVPVGITIGGPDIKPDKPPQSPSVSIKLKNISLMDALKYISKTIGFQILVNDEGVYLTSGMPPEPGTLTAGCK